jgi:starch phosphorylase
MAHLAFIGSHHVNGVSALHSELMHHTVFHDLARTSPTRMVNVTNGISFRRWLYEANPGLTALLVETLGPRVLDDPDCLEQLDRVSEDPGFVARFAGARAANKAALTELVRARTGIRIPPQAMFDVHIKRIHEYKRQLLNIVATIALYQELIENPDADIAPRVKIFAGKAAASYDRAKLIIKLATDVAAIVNSDHRIGDRLKVVFIPNYGISLAEAIIPAADLSEQISTAGMEASGTGNMKLALNGALTIGTLDGANIEMRQRVGPDNITIFGLTAADVAARQQAQFHGAQAIEASPRLAAVVRSLAAGAFSPDDPARVAPIVEMLRGYDPFRVAAEFDAYWNAQGAIDGLWQTPAAWWRASILNTARMGWFSSDRAIREYAGEIWQVPVS